MEASPRGLSDRKDHPPYAWPQPKRSEAVGPTPTREDERFMAAEGKLDRGRGSGRLNIRTRDRGGVDEMLVAEVSVDARHPSDSDDCNGKRAVEGHVALLYCAQAQAARASQSSAKAGSGRAGVDPRERIRERNARGESGRSNTPGQGGPANNPESHWSVVAPAEVSSMLTGPPKAEFQRSGTRTAGTPVLQKSGLSHALGPPEVLGFRHAAYGKTPGRYFMTDVRACW